MMFETRTIFNVTMFYFSASYAIELPLVKPATSYQTPRLENTVLFLYPLVVGWKEPVLFCFTTGLLGAA